MSWTSGVFDWSTPSWSAPTPDFTPSWKKPMGFGDPFATPGDTIPVNAGPETPPVAQEAPSAGDQWGLSPFDYEDAQKEAQQAYGMQLVQGAFSHSWDAMGMALNQANIVKKKVQDKAEEDAQKRLQDRQKFLTDQQEADLSIAQKKLMNIELNRKMGIETNADAAYKTYLQNNPAIDTVLSSYEQQAQGEKDPLRAGAMANKLAVAKAQLGLYGQIGDAESAANANKVLDDLNKDLQKPYDLQQMLSVYGQKAALHDGYSSVGDMVNATQIKDASKQQYTSIKEALDAARTQRALNPATAGGKGELTDPNIMARDAANEDKLNEPLNGKMTVAQAAALGLSDDWNLWPAQIAKIREQNHLKAHQMTLDQIAFTKQNSQRGAAPSTAPAPVAGPAKAVQNIGNAPGTGSPVAMAAFNKELNQHLVEAQQAGKSPVEIAKYKTFLTQELGKKYGIQFSPATQSTLAQDLGVGN